MSSKIKTSGGIVIRHDKILFIYKNGRWDLPKGKLEKGNNANFILSLESPITVSMDDRFVIRSYSPMHTIAGGIVLYNDIKGKWSNMRDFTKMLPLDPKERFGYLVKFNWKTPMSIKDWKLLFYNSNEKIDLWIEEFSLEQSDEGILYSKDRIERSRDQFVQFFNDSYAKNTFRSVLTIDSIKNALNWSNTWIDIVSKILLDEGIIKFSSGGFSLTNYKIQFSSKDKSDMANIENIIEQAGSQPVLMSKIIEASGQNPKRAGDLVHILVDKKKVQPLDNDLFLIKGVFDSLLLKIRNYFNVNTEMKVADFKDLTGLTRKTAIPVLEYLDKNRYTNRKDNIRLIGEAFNE